jgi:hypothetical protein
MATITFNEAAPAESVCFNFPHGTFELASGGTFETEDFRLIDEAMTHPWLTVDVPHEAVEARFRDNFPAPENDPMSMDNPANQAALTVEAADAFEDEKDAEEEEIFTTLPLIPPPPVFSDSTPPQEEVDAEAATAAAEADAEDEETTTPDTTEDPDN